MVKSLFRDCVVCLSISQSLVFSERMTLVLKRQDGCVWGNRERERERESTINFILSRRDWIKKRGLWWFNRLKVMDRRGETREPFLGYLKSRVIERQYQEQRRIYWWQRQARRIDPFRQEWWWCHWLLDSLTVPFVPLVHHKVLLEKHRCSFLRHAFDIKRVNRRETEFLVFYSRTWHRLSFHRLFPWLC